MRRFSRRQKVYLGISFAVFAIHVVLAAVLQKSFAFTIVGDAYPCVLLIVALLAVRDNLRRKTCVLVEFWQMFQAGLIALLVCQADWIFYDAQKLEGTPSPVFGDSMFLLAHVFFLFTLALRPHSVEAG